MTLSIIATTTGLVEAIKEKELSPNEIKERVSVLSKMALDNPESDNFKEIHHQLTVLTDTLKKIYDFKARDDFIIQAIDTVIQTCNTLNSKNQLKTPLPAEPLFTIIDHLPFSKKSDVEKVVAILKEIEPKGKPPPDVKNYHKHLMDSFIKKVNESAVPLKYFAEETLKWLVPKLSHLNLLGLKAGKFLNTYQPTNAKTYSISATEFAKLSRERQEDILLKITHFDLKKIQADRFNEMLYKAVNAKTYSIDAKNLAGFSVEQISKIGPKIIDLEISEDDLSGEQFASLMENCINLCHLKIDTYAASISDSWPFTKQLKTLNCHNCIDLKKLPNNMTKLEELKCSYCPGLIKLPDDMIRLRELDCQWCLDMQKLPDNLTEVELLDCCHTMIKSLPDDMTNLRQLTCDILIPRNVPPDCSITFIDMWTFPSTL